MTVLSLSDLFTFCNIKGIIDLNAFFIPSRMSSSVVGIVLYTRFFTYPHRKKSGLFLYFIVDVYFQYDSSVNAVKFSDLVFHLRNGALLHGHQ
ncbi:hypothetical protein ABEB36_014524 [Hypothenemus hampei]|uniref:Uncharacterized protein n=1 Tax=Hypothenemus hampei TaxID=57062 RepID=A0ABD1E301_HYPHA